MGRLGDALARGSRFRDEGRSSDLVRSIRAWHAGTEGAFGPYPLTRRPYLVRNTRAISSSRVRCRNLPARSTRRHWKRGRPVAPPKAHVRAGRDSPGRLVVATRRYRSARCRDPRSQRSNHAQRARHTSNDCSHCLARSVRRIGGVGRHSRGRLVDYDLRRRVDRHCPRHTSRRRDAYQSARVSLPTSELANASLERGCAFSVVL